MAPCPPSPVLPPPPQDHPLPAEVPEGLSLLLVTIGFGGLLSNIPGAGIAEPGGLLYLTYEVGIKTGAFPLIIFMGVGAMTDFGPLIANPKTALLGAAAQGAEDPDLLLERLASPCGEEEEEQGEHASAVGPMGTAQGRPSFVQGTAMEARRHWAPSAASREDRTMLLQLVGVG